MIPTTSSTRERRDWTLLIFIIPIGILLMLAAGQFAIRLVPEWSVKAGMQSNLDPNNLPKQQNVAIQPVLPAILTPLGWLDTFLTPGAGSDNQVVFPPFVVFEPSATPEVTLPPPTATKPSPTAPTSTPPTAVVTPPPATETETSKPPDDEETPTPPPTPPTVPPVISTPTGNPVIPAPTDIVGAPDLFTYNLQDGDYIVLDLGTTPLIVEGTSDTDYDLVYHELVNCSGVCMDAVIIGISNSSTGATYYEVFNWGNGVPDTNSNVGDVVLSTGTEEDNQSIDISELDGTIPFKTGILIDVDNAPSHPPVGSYQYLVIQAPETSADDGADINSVEVVEVPNP